MVLGIPPEVDSPAGTRGHPVAIEIHRCFSGFVVAHVGEVRGLIVHCIGLYLCSTDVSNQAPIIFRHRSVTILA